MKCNLIIAGLVATTALACGCTSNKPAVPAPGHSDASVEQILALSQSAREGNGLDAPPAMQLVFQVDIYQLSLPVGTYATNEAFWKRMDEQCVDVETYDRLYRNGVRVGVANRSEMRHFEKYMQGIVPTQRFTITASEIKNVEIETKMNLPQQVIWGWDAAGTMSGRSYDRSDNVISLSFEPTPRKPGWLRLTMCPTVRAHRRHLEFSVTNEEREIEFVSPESLYEMNMCVDVPMNGMLVVAPSENALSMPVVGRAFLTKDTPTQQVEQVLLVIPRAYRKGDPESVMPK